MAWRLQAAVLQYAKNNLAWVVGLEIAIRRFCCDPSLPKRWNSPLLSPSQRPVLIALGKAYRLLPHVEGAAPSATRQQVRCVVQLIRTAAQPMEPAVLLSESTNCPLPNALLFAAVGKDVKLDALLAPYSQVHELVWTSATEATAIFKVFDALCHAEARLVDNPSFAFRCEAVHTRMRSAVGPALQAKPGWQTAIIRRAPAKAAPRAGPPSGS
jgi:hypothetical protein